MALPVTISGSTGPQNSYHGPSKSSGGNFYTIIRSFAFLQDVRAWKATDPTSSFTAQDTTNDPRTDDAILSLNVNQSGDDLHVAAQSASDNVYYARFDASADTWDAIDGASDRDILIDGAPNGAADACDLVVRGDGDIAVVYQKEVEKVMGNPYERVGLSVSTSANRGETWSAVVRVDNQGSVERDMTGPRIVLGDSDTSHIVWQDGTSPNTMSQRALSSADVLQTERTDITGADDLGSLLYNIGRGISFSRSATTKIRFPYKAADGDLSILEFDAAADPSTFSVTVDVDGINIVNSFNSSAVLSLAVDGSTVHEMHVRQADFDLYTANDQDSDTWTSPAGATRGTGTKNHVSCRVYARSGQKLARIEDDGGTVKYDEDDIAGGDISLSPGSANLSFSTATPTLARTEDHQRAPAAANLAFTTFAPTCNINKDRSPGAADLAFSTVAPTLLVTEDIGRDPGSVDLAFTTTAPTLAHTLDHQRDPASADLSFSTVAPTLDISADLMRDPGPADLILSTFAPALAFTDNILRDPGPADLAFSTVAPTLARTEDHQRDPGSVDLTFSTTAPSLSLGDDLNFEPGARDLVLSTVAPVLARTLDHQRDPASADLVLSTVAPALTRTLDILLEPGRADLAFSTFAPTLARTEDILIAPGNADLMLSTTAPSLDVTLDLAFSPANDNLVFSTTAPTLVVTGLVAGNRHSVHRGSGVTFSDSTREDFRVGKKSVSQES